MGENESKKADEKKRLSAFWEKRWIKGRTVETWLKSIKENPSIYTRWNRERVTNIIIDGLKKLTLEKKISQEEFINLKAMINSPDDENKMIALCVMQRLKRTKFKK